MTDKMPINKALLLQEHLEKLVYRFMIMQNGLLRKETAEFSMSELKVIVFIGKKNRCIMREIAENLFIQKNNLTPLMDKLVKKNVVERIRGDEDRRVVHVSLTPGGRRLFQQEMESYLDLSKGMLAALEPDEQDQLIALMNKMNA